MRRNEKNWNLHFFGSYGIYVENFPNKQKGKNAIEAEDEFLKTTVQVTSRK